MIDLTGANLASYLLRIVRTTVEKHPRFRAALGTVTFSSNVAIRWKDVEVIIKNIATQGTRLSPNYFMRTELGRALVAKVGDKDGQFIEWARETDRTRNTPEPGIYYINVDFFDDQTRDLGLTVHKYKWREGSLSNAVGSQVFFRPGIVDPSSVPPGPLDLTTLTATDAATGGPVQFVAFNSSFGGFANLLTPVQTLRFAFQNGTLLLPGVDYWYQRVQTSPVVTSTKGGSEVVEIPNLSGTLPPFVSFTLTDQTGYELRPGIDWNFYGAGWVQLSSQSPPGSTIYANILARLDPSLYDGTNPENNIQIGLLPNETLAPGQITIQTSQGSFTTATLNPDGTMALPVLLQPGDYLRWSIRIDTGQSKASAKKWELNSFVIVDPSTIAYTVPASALSVPAGEPQPQAVQSSAGTPLLDASGSQQYVFPGLVLAIGDRVVVGDQAAVIVTPDITETYEVFGSKENLSFTLEIKSNDLQTSSDLTEMLKDQLLISRRINTEADGLTV